MDLLLQKLNKVTLFTQKRKLARIASFPFVYFQLLFYKLIKYKLFGKASIINCNTIWNESIQVSLPSSSDIYITGCKTHDSEIRLCKYLIANSYGKIFIDIGGHIGFFSLLVNFVNKGKVKIIAIEPSENTYAILKNNTEKYNNISILKCAIGNDNKEIGFYTFPEKYAENNTANVSQFINQNWFAKNKPKCTTVAMITLNELLSKKNVVPNIIKIDVEGSEDMVIEGCMEVLTNYSPIVIMEFFNVAKNNKSHTKAEDILIANGYQNFRIADDGILKKINTSTNHYFSTNQIDSDNIVYVKI